MNFGNIVKGAGQLLKRNSSTILTGLGVAGSVGAVILGIKVTPTVIRKLDRAYLVKNQDPDTPDESLTFVEVIKVAWKDYLPVVILEGAVIGCVIGAQSINLRRQAAWISAFTVSETALREYQERMSVEAPHKDQKVRGDMAQAKLDANPISKSEVVIIGNGDQLFFEPTTGRYFMSNMQKVQKAVNDINFRVLNQNYASMNEFFTLLGLDSTDLGDELGWTPEHELEVDYKTKLTEDDRPAIVLDYWRLPLKNYWKGFQ